METTAQKITELKNQISELEKQEKKVWIRKTGISDVLIYENNEYKSVNFKCKNLDEVKKVLVNFKPYLNSFELDTTPKIYVSSPYRIEIRNNYYDRMLLIRFNLINNTNINIEIDFNNLQDTEMLYNYFSKTFRHLYTTETVYVNIPAHYKKFKDIRIPAISFKFGNFIKWYGGNLTLTDEKTINDIINAVKNL